MDFGLVDLLDVYEVKKVENMRYTLFLRSRRLSHVDNTGAKDIGWKKKYVFMEKPSLGKEYVCDGWKAEGIILTFL